MVSQFYVNDNDRKEREGMDWNDSETIRMLETIGKLQSELAAANARISELERCCVVGGDGEPFTVGDEMFYRRKISGSIIGFLTDKIEITKQGTTVGGFEQLDPSDCYSSPESVPEGEKKPT